jgi:hypothetical protein
VRQGWVFLDWALVARFGGVSDVLIFVGGGKAGENMMMG